jgi:uncharacterized membrane protein
MATASASVEIPASASEVWRLIGGFGSLPDWLPYIPKSELHEGGRVRHLANSDGGLIVERLMAFDEAGRSYSYYILQSPIPQQGYLSTLRVRETGDGQRSRVEWSGEFQPAGVSDAEVSKLFQGIYEDGLAALRMHYADNG